MHVKALPGRPYDGHTLRMVLPKIERLTGARLKRVYVDDGYRGHGLAPGFPRQPEAERDAGHPAGAAAAGGHRAGDRASEGRPPHGHGPQRSGPFARVMP